ncbi:nonsense-mediated mRNA decay factor SMG8 isoform X2 [Neocloeon triangulifer]|uniref:nonsense-mediated mRNA decay factor SMG8 isoform X2 n=1 Tax=Neocloeon triangulifer TaxID=2078957 RepID=UPI00286F11C5|nr:nonsense-mediated mRNA decay factor SMG8 isoform X2 [Neocloeon triangulifer]
MISKFSFPLDESSKKIFDEEKGKCVVVSFFGKSDVRSFGCKGAPADEASDRHVFAGRNATTPVDPRTQVLVEGFHDKANRILYLHLRSPYDAFHFAELVSDESKSPQELLSEFRSQHAKALLFLFCVSHILVLSSPSPRFETPYLQLFRTLDLIRQKAAPVLTDHLQKVSGVGADWVAQQRLCAPRMLFYFESKQLGARSQLKRLEHSVEDQIYRLLRRCRIITNSTVNSLFAIPLNHEYVFIEDQDLNVLDKTQQAVNRALKFCLGLMEEKPKTNEPPPKIHNFREFLFEHVDSALSKGFDDTLGRHTSTAHFEVPPLSVWSSAAQAVYKVFLGEETSNSKHRQLLNMFSTSFNASIRFSEARCKKVLPLAFASYQEGLPTHYTQAYHDGRLAYALSVFSQHARGPSCAKYVEGLKKSCDEHWHDGRQMCEVLSLTGNPCTQPLHLTIDEEEPCQTALQKKEPLSTIPHLSGVRYVSTCNCGRKQGPREDPFVLRTANCDFYAALAADCCDRHEKWAFPVFQPSIKDFKAARVAVDEDTGKQEKFSFGGLLSGMDEAAQMKDGDEFVDQQLFLRMEEMCLDSAKEKGLVRQASTTEYLPGMLHSGSPVGLLPQFPSWSLVCLGPSSVYSHNHGLTDQPGFLPGSAYLLPWDVSVRFEPSEMGKAEAKWTSVGTAGVNIPVSPNQQRKFGGNVKNRKTKVGKDHIEFSVKIFLGIEYECPRGHRFMLSSPDKMLKASGSGIVKETGAKVASSDMPLYCLCPCKMNSKPLLAQLMRIHVVTPKAPVHITLNPKVQPAPDPCPLFVVGLNEPLKLSQSAYWILRLPFVYMAEQNLYRAPKEPVPLNFGRLLAGCYGIVQAPPTNF